MVQLAGAELLDAPAGFATDPADAFDVVVPSLPGFGFSERSDRIYTPELMTAAIHAMVAEIRHRHGGAAIDVMALSLSAEFLARAALARPDDYHSLGLISPTGFDKRYERRNPSGSDTARAVAAYPLWGQALFDLLVSRRRRGARTVGCPARRRRRRSR